MVIHEPTGGGAVFSVGSITYPATLLVDDNISRITKNILTRFSPLSKCIFATFG